MEVVERVVSRGHGALSPSHVCVHETANPGATALNHVSLWSRDDTYAVHYVGDWTGKCYRCVPEDRLCWQVGNGNAHVIGIELCHATTAAQFAAVWALGVEWAAWMLRRMGWGTDRLISHDDARRMWGGTDHTDPIGYFAEFGRTWADFVADVRRALDGKTEGKEDEVKKVLNKGGEFRRYLDAKTGNHVFTADAKEQTALKKAGWKDEGVAWTAKASARTAVYRMSNPVNGDHLWTTSYKEASACQRAGWAYEGVPFFASGAGVEVRRYLGKGGLHHLTADPDEQSALKKAGWKDEGVAFRV